MELLLIPGAFLAGVLMFLAPCTLPIVPGYLAFIAGVSPGEEKGARGRIVRNAIWFVVGFTVVFVLLGTFAGYVGVAIGPWRTLVARLAGLVIIFFGLTMLGVIKFSFITAEHRARIPKFLSLGRPESSLLIGALFALGWSPCIGPILGTILFIATMKSAFAGALLLTIFSLGLGLPFILAAIFINKFSAQVEKFSRLATVLSYIGGVVLVFIGVLMLLGDMGLLVTWGFGLFDSAGYGHLLQYL